jgi:GNAT superfamily N-acetyltransferase
MPTDTLPRAVPEFLPARPDTHRAALLDLNIEYMAWVLEGVAQTFGVPRDEVVGMPARDYVPTVIDKVCGDPPPKDVFYIVDVAGEHAGMGGFRHLAPGVAEIKRVYVRPAFRGRNLGDLVLARLLADGARFGYRRFRLDTAPFMTAAHRLYERNGFTDCAAYAGLEVPPEYRHRWRFMERAL